MHVIGIFESVNDGIQVEFCSCLLKTIESLNLDGIT